MLDGRSLRRRLDVHEHANDSLERPVDPHLLRAKQGHIDQPDGAGTGGGERAGEVGSPVRITLTTWSLEIALRAIIAVSSSPTASRISAASLA